MTDDQQLEYSFAIDVRVEFFLLIMLYRIGCTVELKFYLQLVYSILILLLFIVSKTRFIILLQRTIEFGTAIFLDSNSLSSDIALTDVSINSELVLVATISRCFCII